MATADEFDYGEATPAGRAGKLAMYATLAVFCIAIFGTALVDTFFPAPGITLFGGELATQQRLDEEAELWDGTLAKRFEYYQREHSMVRSIVLPRYGFFRFAYLHDVTSGMIAGRDDWLFLERRVRLAPEMSIESLSRTAVAPFVALDRRLASNGIEFTVLPIPRKSYVAKDALPGSIDDRYEYDDLVFDGLIDGGVHVVDLRETFRGRDPEEVYFKLDSHWTAEGALLAAEACADAMGMLKPAAERLGDVRVTVAEPDARIGMQLMRSIQVNPQRVDMSVLNLRTPRIVAIGLGPEGNAWYRNPRPDVPVALAGTSFSWNGRVAKGLAHYTGRPVYDGALQGGDFMRAVGGVLRDYRAEGGLEHLIWETQTAPIVVPYRSTGAWFTDALGEVFDVLPPRASHRIAKFPKAWWRVPSGGAVDLSNLPRRPLLISREGAVLHTGDGVAALELSGEVTGAPARLALDIGGVQYEHLVAPGPFRVALPLLADGTSDARVVLFAMRSQGSTLRLTRADLVHEPAGPDAVPVDVAQEGALLRLSPRRPLRFGRRAALVVVTQPESPGRADLVVRVTTSAGEQRFAFDAIQPGGALAIDLGAHRGEALVDVTLESGAVPVNVAAASITGVE